jgi:hypothetical protein
MLPIFKFKAKLSTVYITVTVLLRPVSKNIIQEKKKEKNINIQDNKELPFFPKKRVKKNDVTELNKGNKKIAKYIINL